MTKTKYYWMCWIYHDEPFQEHVFSQKKACMRRGPSSNVVAFNLLSGEMLYNSMLFSDFCRLKVAIAQGKLPKREAALRVIRAAEQRRSRRSQVAKEKNSPASKMAGLLTKEKEWLRKHKLATTKLRALRKRIAYYRKKVS